LSIILAPLRTAFVVALLALGAPRETSEAQETPLRTHPFALGEQSVYRAGWGIFGSAGTGTFTLSADTVRGERTLHAVLAIRGGIPGLRIDERLESWMSPSTLAAHRFLQHTRYPRFSRDRLRDFFASERRWTGHTNMRPEVGELSTARPLDELGFILVARSARLTIGDDLQFNDYWKADANPVRLKVLRREVVKVPAGTFNTIVVQPIIRTSGLFAEKGEAEVYISEGPAHELVMLRAKLSIGTLVLQLEKFTPGATP
jgi:Protein of unknown function (DUF3108)